METIREGASIILVKDPKEQYTYHVEESSKGRDPWFEGTTFFPARTSEGHLKSLEGHYFGMMRHRNGDGTETENIVRIAHSERELNEALLENARSYCLKLAQEVEKFFVDDTSHVLSP